MTHNFSALDYLFSHLTKSCLLHNTWVAPFRTSCWTGKTGLHFSQQIYVLRILHIIRSLSDDIVSKLDYRLESIIFGWFWKMNLKAVKGSCCSLIKDSVLAFGFRNKGVTQTPSLRLFGVTGHLPKTSKKHDPVHWFARYIWLLFRSLQRLRLKHPGRLSFARLKHIWRRSHHTRISRARSLLYNKQ
jgi:hypothetical protein